jgi:hypothetical protein
MREHEREAEQGPTTTPAAAHGERAGLLQLQRDAGNAAVAGVLDVVGSGGGASLDTDTRSFMERSLGADFSDVRVHTGDRADTSARSVGASAYTTGSDLVFADGQYAPGTDTGLRTLAHELTHVVQQRSGPVDGTPAGNGSVAVSAPGDRFEVEADRAAEQLLGDAG